MFISLLIAKQTNLYFTEHLERWSAEKTRKKNSLVSNTFFGSTPFYRPKKAAGTVKKMPEQPALF